MDSGKEVTEAKEESNTELYGFRKQVTEAKGEPSEQIQVVNAQGELPLPNAPQVASLMGTLRI